jgi:hypothetical protein
MNCGGLLRVGVVVCHKFRAVCGLCGGIHETENILNGAGDGALAPALMITAGTATAL